MKLAAIDIGSNAIRFQVISVLHYQGLTEFKKIEYVRFPLRLGHDVFSTGRISEISAIKFKKLMQAFKILLDLYEVDNYMACATSAMRESENGKQIAEEIKKDLNLKIRIIDGNMEANLINKAIYTLIDNEPKLHIDVGGGSTELNMIVNRKKVISESFPIGSVRRLEHYDSPEIWKAMEKWVQNNITNRYKKLIAVGTGGNINKIMELSQKLPGKKISLNKIKEIRDELYGYSQEEKIHKLKLNPDRADVIIPASDIYISVMQWAKIKSMMVPNMGLKDGILSQLWGKVASQSMLPFSKD